MKALGRMIDDVFSLCSIASNKTNCDNFTKSAHLQGRDCRACPFFFFFNFLLLSQAVGSRAELLSFLAYCAKVGHWYSESLRIGTFVFCSTGVTCLLTVQSRSSQWKCACGGCVARFILMAAVGGLAVKKVFAF